VVKFITLTSITPGILGINSSLLWWNKMQNTIRNFRFLTNYLKKIHHKFLSEVDWKKESDKPRDKNSKNWYLKCLLYCLSTTKNFCFNIQITEIWRLRFFLFVTLLIIHFISLDRHFEIGLISTVVWTTNIWSYKYFKMFLRWWKLCQ
jgi:hypothetical protein